MQQPSFRDAFYKPDGKGWRAPGVNETCCVRTNLADLLDAIGAQGPDALYLQHGNDLAAEIQAAGGIVTAADLQSANPVVKEPLVIRVCPVPHSPCKTPYILTLHVSKQVPQVAVLAPTHPVTILQLPVPIMQLLLQCLGMRARAATESGASGLHRFAGLVVRTITSLCICCAGQGAGDAGAAASQWGSCCACRLPDDCSIPGRTPLDSATAALPFVFSYAGSMAGTVPAPVGPLKPDVFGDRGTESRQHDRLWCMQAPMAFAGFHGRTDESQLVQPPLAFSGRSRTHRLVEVRPVLSQGYRDMVVPGGHRVQQLTF